LHGCQKSGYDSGGYERVVKVGTRRDISPTDGLLLEQLPTPYFPPTKLRRWGVLAQEARQSLPVCDVCFCRSHTPEKRYYCTNASLYTRMCK